jgi:hypothetical protein
MPVLARGLFCAVLVSTLALPRGALALQPATPWSADGSAEAAALRAQALQHGQFDRAAAAGQRGLVFQQSTGQTGAAAPQYGVIAATPGAPPPPGGGVVPAPDVPEPDVPSVGDLERSYKLEQVKKRGRAMFIPGVVFGTLGTILVIGAIAGMASEVNGVTGGLLGGSLALCGVGYPLLFVGVHMRKHPDKYVRDGAQAAVSPTGLVVRF